MVRDQHRRVHPGGQRPAPRRVTTADGGVAAAQLGRLLEELRFERPVEVAGGQARPQLWRPQQAFSYETRGRHPWGDSRGGQGPTFGGSI